MWERLLRSPKTSTPQVVVGDSVSQSNHFFVSQETEMLALRRGGGRQLLPRLSLPLTRVFKSDLAAGHNHTNPPTAAARLQHSALGVLTLRDPIALPNAALLLANERQRDRASRPSKILERAGSAATNRAFRWQLEPPRPPICAGGVPEGETLRSAAGIYVFQLSRGVAEGGQ